MLEDLEDIDTTLKGLRSTSDDHQTCNKGKEGRFVIKQTKDKYR